MTTYNDTIEESIDVTESHIIGWLDTIDDGVDLTESQSALCSYLNAIDEGLDLTESHKFGFGKSITDIIFMYETLTHGWGVSINESLSVADTLSEGLGLMISDWVTLVDSQTNNWQGREIVNDSLTVFDIAALAQHYAKSVSDDLSLTDVPTWVLLLNILESLRFSELVKSIKTMTESVSDSINAAESSLLAFPEAVESILSAVDVSSVVASFAHSLQSALKVADSSSIVKTSSGYVSEAIAFAENISSKGTLYSLIYNTLRLNVIVELADEVYECYVLNSPQFHASMYSGYNFNSFCVFENRAFGANDEGIYELTGTTDAGSHIHTGVILSKTDFGLPNKKRFRSGYLGISGTNPVMIMETESGERQVYTITSGKMIASHDLKSRSWKLAVAEFDEIDSLELIPVILTK